MHQTGSILIIDQQPALVDVLGEILTAAGNIAYTVLDGVHALVAIAQHSPVLIVSDTRLLHPFEPSAAQGRRIGAHQWVEPDIARGCQQHRTNADWQVCHACVAAPQWAKLVGKPGAVVDFEECLSQIHLRHQYVKCVRRGRATMVCRLTTPRGKLIA